MGIGKVLSDLIEQKKTNANEIAKLANVPAQTLYSMIRRDSMKVDIDVLIKVSQALGVDVEYFYNKYVNGELTSKFNEKLTIQEQSHIKKYRALDEGGRQTVDAVLQIQFDLAVAKQESTGLTAENKRELEAYKQELLAAQKGQTFAVLESTEKAANV